MRAAGLSKQYKLGQAASLDHGIREVLSTAMQGLAQMLRPLTTHGQAEKESRRELFWALHDVSFTIEPGTVVGLIGRNGAGKSTLLKILSRITAPTTGEAWINGRVASLLEVGTGFQPDLTGRENVFLNGAILGMRRREVRANFNDIVEFAQLEQFIDTPVKRYSSGMFMRLAFSVAAHLDAEILLMDEVLAVGDVAFQRRCLDKIDQVTDTGRTVIFVSHKLDAVRRLCPRSIYLDMGQLVADGPTEEVLSRYVRDTLEPAVHDERDERGARLFRWHLDSNVSGDEHTCVAGDVVTLRAQLSLSRALRGASFQFALRTDNDEVVLSASSRDGGRPSLDLQPGAYELSLSVRLPLRDGHYGLELALCNEYGQDVERTELPPRLVILPREGRALGRERRGVVDEPVSFECAAVLRD